MTRSTLLRSVRSLEIEEKILNLSSFIAMIGVFIPWFGGEWFGEPASWSGFQFYTSFIGLLVFIGHVFILSLTLIPILGYQIVRPALRDLLRLIVSLECVLLTVVVWSVLTNISFDRSQMQIRFGIYLTLVGSIITALYAFLRREQRKKRALQELFHHPEDETPTPELPAIKRIADSHPMPPPPPPGEPEEPKLF